MFEGFIHKARELKRGITALSLASRGPRAPWYSKAWVVCLIAYALSPIDLNPDPIPVPGCLDDLLLLTYGIYIAVKVISEAVLVDWRAAAAIV